MMASSSSFRIWATIAFCLPILGSGSARADMSLADAYKVIASKQLIDLTHSFDSTTPVWAGFGQATLSAASIRRPTSPTRSNRPASGRHSIRWLANTGRMSIRRPISTKTA